MYKIRYLPLALDDLKVIVRYIAFELESPQAAEKFRIKLNKEVRKIAVNPFRCHLYTPPKKLKFEYRVLHIDNYSLFYYVADNSKIEIHRVIYSKRDFKSILHD